MIVLKADKIEKSYTVKNIHVGAIKTLSIEIEQGETVAIMGQSGSGKSTLLSILGTLDKADRGELYIDGQNINKFSDNSVSKFRNNNLGLVFQNFYLQPFLKVWENVALPLVFSGQYSTKEIQEKSLLALYKVGLGDRAEFYPNQLSGGQVQRVAIARSIISSPKIILADEPTGNLDRDTSKYIQPI